MLNYSLNLTWDTTVNRWMVVSTDFGEQNVEGANAVTDIHVMNMAMSQIIKIYEVLDTPIVVTQINVVPGQVVANSVPATVLS